MKSFADIANEVGTDKHSGCGYGPHYEKYVFPFVDRRKPHVILEVGVHNGSSLRLWEQLYPFASIIGIDIDPRCTQYASDRSKVFIGNQSDRPFLESIATSINSPISLVVDDGSHDINDQIVSFDALWPFVSSVYVIEDIWHEWLPRLLRHIDNCVVKPSTSPNRFILFAHKIP